MERVVVVTPAGRRRYLEILAQYIASDVTIDRWELWDNCRTEKDRKYLDALAADIEKAEIRRLPVTDGTNTAINQFYKTASNDDTFYIKMDDDIVWLPKNFGKRLLEVALEEKGDFLWWSPLVINNAICTWLIKHHTKAVIPAKLSAQAGSPMSWRSAAFAENLHSEFLAAIESGINPGFSIPRQVISASRFSINCIGFFGSDVSRLGEKFCPVGVDDEEWISAILPSLVSKCGRIATDIVVSHFSFNVQERQLLRSRILGRYARLSGVIRAEKHQKLEGTMQQRSWLRLKRFIRNKLLEYCLVRGEPEEVRLGAAIINGDK